MPKTIHGQPVDEKLWGLAKRKAHEAGHGGDYAYVTAIFKKLNGVKSSLTKEPRGDLFDNLYISEMLPLSQAADYQELAAGEIEELEHTDDPAVARRIATEHLQEHPDYYSKLDDAGLLGPEAQRALQSSPAPLGRYSQALHQATKKTPKFPPEALQAWAQEINQKGFDGALELNFPITQDMRSTTAWGMCYTLRGAVSRIRLNSLYDLPQFQAYATLAHELCHVAQVQLDGGIPARDSHGPSFDHYFEQLRSRGVSVSKSEVIQNVTLADKSKLQGFTVGLLAQRGPRLAFFNCRKASVGQIVKFAVNLSSQGSDITLVTTDNPVALSTNPTLRKGAPSAGAFVDNDNYEDIKSDEVFSFKWSDIAGLSQEDSVAWLDQLEAHVRDAFSHARMSVASSFQGALP